MWASGCAVSGDKRCRDNVVESYGDVEDVDDEWRLYRDCNREGKTCVSVGRVALCAVTPNPQPHCVGVVDFALRCDAEGVASVMCQEGYEIERVACVGPCVEDGRGVQCSAGAMIEPACVGRAYACIDGDLVRCDSGYAIERNRCDPGRVCAMAELSGYAGCAVDPEPHPLCRDWGNGSACDGNQVLHCNQTLVDWREPCPHGCTQVFETYAQCND